MQEEGDSRWCQGAMSINYQRLWPICVKMIQRCNLVHIGFDKNAIHVFEAARAVRDKVMIKSKYAVWAN